MIASRPYLLEDPLALAIPQQLYLRHSSGQPLGPIPLRSLEILFDARVVDEGTPVSPDGAAFRPVREWPEVLVRLLDVKEQADQGQDPWATVSQDLATADLDPDKATFLAILLRTAANKTTGYLRISRSDGTIQVGLKDGKVATVDTTIPDLSLEAFLKRASVVNDAVLARAKTQAPSFGGDLGGALIGLGVVQPHTYFEYFVTWAIQALGAAAASPAGTTKVDLVEVAPATVPLGLDRLGVLTEVVRKGIAKSYLTDVLHPKRVCPVIISQVEGVNVEDCKPQARELRVLNAIDGVKTLGQLLDTYGTGGEENHLQVLRAIYFATECGFAVFGDDPFMAKELVEANELQKLLATMEGQHFFEILKVSEKSSDDETRTRYTELAKKYHTDTLRPEAHPELKAVRSKIFALITEAFEALDTEKKRYDYSQELAQGRVGNSQDLQKAQDILQSETLFKKAEILVKVRKYEEALEHLDRAIVLNSNDTEFKIFRAYLGYLVGSRQGGREELAQEAIKKILGLMKNEPMIASGYLWLAHLNKAVGKPEVSLKYYEKVLEFDEHHVEAQRELRTAAMRKEKDDKNKKKWPFSR